MRRSRERQRKQDEHETSKRRSRSMIQAVLFDLDGTILDTNELIIQSFFTYV